MNVDMPHAILLTWQNCKKAAVEKKWKEREQMISGIPYQHHMCDSVLQGMKVSEEGSDSQSLAGQCLLIKR